MLRIIENSCKSEQYIYLFFILETIYLFLFVLSSQFLYYLAIISPRQDLVCRNSLKIQSVANQYWPKCSTDETNSWATEIHMSEASLTWSVLEQWKSNILLYKYQKVIKMWCTNVQTFKTFLCVLIVFHFRQNLFSTMYNNLHMRNYLQFLSSKLFKNFFIDESCFLDKWLY